MMDGTVIGATAGVAASHATRLTTPDDPMQSLHAQHLYDILCTLRDIELFFKRNAKLEQYDQFFIIQLFKAGLGQNWIPRKGDNEYLMVYALQATAILVTSPLAPPTTITIPALTFPQIWNVFDFPDGTSFTLDPTASANSLSIYVRRTNVHV